MLEMIFFVNRPDQSYVFNELIGECSSDNTSVRPTPDKMNFIMLEKFQFIHNVKLNKWIKYVNVN